MNSPNLHSSGSQRLDHLDGIRGIAAFSVMIGHIRWPSAIATLPPFHNISLWVDFFFVLSGFVIAHAYFRKLSTGMPVTSFMARRFARLYPLHLLTLFAAVAYELLKWKMLGKVGVDAQNAPFENNNWSAFISNIFLIHSMGLFPDVTWNGPSWSISVEFYTYLTFAVLVALTRARKAAFWASLVFLQLFSFGILAFCTQGDFLSVETDYGFFRCLLGFGLGVTLQHFSAQRANASAAGYVLSPRTELPLHEPGGGSRDGLKALLAGAILVFIACPTYKTPSTLAAPFLFAAFIWVLVRYRGGWMERLLLSRPCQLLGALSYTMYMLHSVFRMGFKNLWQIGQRYEPLHQGWGSTLFNEGLTISYVALVLVLSWSCYRAFELPAQRWLNKRFDQARSGLRKEPEAVHATA